MKNTQIVLLLLLVALVAIGVYCVHTSPATNPPAPNPPPAVHSAPQRQAVPDASHGEDDLMDLVEINDEAFGVGGNNGGRYPSEY